MQDLIEMTERGLYCPQGDFYIDPRRGVAKAIITHAHSDHARGGSKSYLTSDTGSLVLRQRLARRAQIDSLPFGKSIEINGVRLSLHPAGHLLGSAQVRVEYRGQVWVVSGDYKTEPDATCEPLELLRCHVFLSEATFALPVFRWRPQAEVFADLQAWWAENQAVGRTSVIFAYALGKAQRLLGGIDASQGPVFVDEAVAKFLPAYEAAGTRLPPTQPVDGEVIRSLRGKALVIAPSSGRRAAWFAELGPCRTAFASGWMQLRTASRRYGVDRGFVLSDHADWPGLLDTIHGTQAQRIGVMHGYTAMLARWLRGHGKHAWVVPDWRPNSNDEPRPSEVQLLLWDLANGDSP